jgi:hypothetical protein
MTGTLNNIIDPTTMLRLAVNIEDDPLRSELLAERTALLATLPKCLGVNGLNDSDRGRFALLGAAVSDRWHLLEEIR